MATGKITKRTVDASEAGFLWDSELRGFGLRTTVSGSRSYIYQYRMGGRGHPAVRHTIGKHGSPWTPSTARDEASRLATLVRQGIDPKADQKSRQRASIDLAFDKYADRFLADYVSTEWKASYPFAEAIVRLHAKPVLGRRPLPTIGRLDITEVLDRLPPTKIALRRNVYAVLRRLFRWAVGRGDIDRSPFDGLEAPASAQSRDRTLTDDELRLVWNAADTLGRPFSNIIHLLIVTGQRREEVGALEWSELDRGNAVWTLPAERSKNGKAHIVPLSDKAVGIIDDVAGSKKWPAVGFVFTTTGKTAVSGYSRAKRRLDAKIEEMAAEGESEAVVRQWRVHDLRRTLATGLQRLGVRFEVTESVLNRVSGSRSGVAGVYQRHDWAAEKRDALARWAAHLDEITRDMNSNNATSNVVAISRPRAAGA